MVNPIALRKVILAGSRSLLSQSVSYWDARFVDNVSNPQFLINQISSGVGNAQFGSSSSTDANDPLWLQFSGQQYVYLPGISSNYVSCPHSAALDITGDIDIRCRWQFSNWTSVTVTGGEGGLITKYQSTATTRSYSFYILATGRLRVRISTVGTDGLNTDSSVATGFANNEIGWVRFTRVRSTGVVTFFTSTDGVTWTQLGTTGINNAGANIYASTQPVFIGAAEFLGTSNMVEGKCYYAEIRNGIDGTIAAKFDASLTGQLGYTDSTNSTVWTVNRPTTDTRKTVVVDRTLCSLGTDDYFDITDNDLLDFGAGQPYTICLGYRDFGNTSGNTAFVAKRNSVLGDAAVGYVARRGSTGLNHLVADGSTSQQTGFRATVQNSATVCAIQRDLSGNISVITNNGITTPATYNLSLDNSLNFRIGALSNATAFAAFEFFACAVFRSVLTLDQISQVQREMNAL